MSWVTCECRDEGERLEGGGSVEWGQRNTYLQDREVIVSGSIQGGLRGAATDQVPEETGAGCAFTLQEALQHKE